MIKVLLADDSGIVRAILKQLMNDDERFIVCATAENGQKAVELNAVFKPDLIIMDINMPVMDGITATKKILSQSSPAVIAFTTEDSADIGFKCLEAGALDVVKKPDLAEMNQSVISSFLDQFYFIAEKNKFNIQKPRKKSLLTHIEQNAESYGLTDFKSLSTSKQYEAVVVGSSTGGPAALLELLTGFGNSFPLPVLITQHIDTQFDVHLVKWLKKNSGQNIKLAENGEIPRPGTFYLAPADRHLTVTGNYESQKIITITDDSPVHYLKPAVDKLFLSAAEAYRDRLIAVILTGMGRDGAEGCRKAFNNGALTIAQDEKTCTVFGMPQAAIKEGGIKQILSLEEIAPFIRRKISL
ncbi:chemotaxis-specific protein-glutamate methyltransferase CheB [Treponema sp.]|uniref:chemotaxis-specific protein-glutamate methyltransferase CheB n=1 Tax=Treponema sp. TaxID=166 RepID=UPI00257EB77A|nr:chemotaxis-specific protein-glutamate methyltransferase CheB [Treponema sp.]MBE6353473.1 chemotaxis-specific protein-glutamate methyltransferase CheB [Treponema sp.]